MCWSHPMSGVFQSTGSPKRGWRTLFMLGIHHTRIPDVTTLEAKSLLGLSASLHGLCCFTFSRLVSGLSWLPCCFFVHPVRSWQPAQVLFCVSLSCFGTSFFLFFHQPMVSAESLRGCLGRLFLVWVLADRLERFLHITLEPAGVPPVCYSWASQAHDFDRD